MQSLRCLLLLLLLANSSGKTASLDDLEFMTGMWQQASSDTVIEEWWMASQGKTKVAAFRWAQGDKIVAIELVIISEEDDGIYLRFKHYSADYMPWEKGEPNVYRLQSTDSSQAVFANTAPRTGIPNVLIYRETEYGLEFRGTNDADAEPGNSDLIIRFRRAVD